MPMPIPFPSGASVHNFPEIGCVFFFHVEGKKNHVKSFNIPQVVHQILHGFIESVSLRSLT